MATQVLFSSMLIQKKTCTLMPLEIKNHRLYWRKLMHFSWNMSRVYYFYYFLTPLLASLSIAVNMLLRDVSQERISYTN